MAGTSILSSASMDVLFDTTEREFSYLSDRYVLEAEQLFMKAIVPENTGTQEKIEEADRGRFAAEKGEGELVSKGEAGLGYDITISPTRFGIELDITYEYDHWNKEPQLASFLKETAEYCPERYDIDLTHRLTFGSATSYVNMDGTTVSTTVGDGLALFSASHTLKHSTTEYTNIVDGAPRLSTGGLTLARDLANTELFDNFGTPIKKMFNTLITSWDEATCVDARELLESNTNVDQNNPNVINVNLRTLRHVKLHNLDTTAVGAQDTTKSKYWFLAAIGGGKKSSWEAYVKVWEPNHLAPIEVDGHRDIKSVGSRMSYGIGVLSGKGIIACFAT